MWYSATATSGPDAMHVIYGGTFDPIHHGHLRLALEVSDALAVDRVHLVPCHIPPHRGDTGATSAQRLELIRLAIAGEERLRVDDRELQRAGASYTADTLRQLRQELGAEAPLVMVVVLIPLPVLTAGRTGSRFQSWPTLWWYAGPGLSCLKIVVRHTCLQAGALPVRPVCGRAPLAGYWSWIRRCWTSRQPAFGSPLQPAVRLVT